MHVIIQINQTILLFSILISTVAMYYQQIEFSVENYFEKQNFLDHIDSLPKIHIYCGEGDPLERLLIGSSKEMKGTLIRYGYPEEKICETYDLEKPHNEESWRLILGDSFTKLLEI